jgi:hypothetical protein
MRKAGSNSHWRGKTALVALALALGSLALLIPHGSVSADAPPFDVSYSITVDPNFDSVGQNAELHHQYDVDDDPWPTAFHKNQITFIPPAWGIAEGDDVPIGAIVGKLISDTTLGWFNNPCSATYGGDEHIEFDPMLNCSTDTSQTVDFDGQFDDLDTNNIPDGCDKYPDFLNTMFPGITPRARMGSFELVAGNWVSLNFLILEPSTSLNLPVVGNFTPEYKLGYLSMSVINDPTGPLVANQITDLCPPLSTDTYDYSPTQDNPSTAADESGYAWRTNPQDGGTYTFTCYATSVPDADNDDIDNELDTCPHVTNVGDPRVEYSGDPDGDGLDSACDDTPSTNDDDPDDDTFPNRQDKCPLVSDASQADADYDGIGDACDQDDWNDDGDTTDPGEPTGFDVNTPDGDYATTWITSEATINAPVGGLAELPNVSDSSSRNYIALAGLAAVALVALSAGAWYARRRWLS